MTHKAQNSTNQGAKTPKSAAPTKSVQVIDLLSQPEGATLEAISKATGWQPHSSRAFMTGLKKKGHIIESDKVDGVRRYYIKATEPA